MARFIEGASQPSNQPNDPEPLAEHLEEQHPTQAEIAVRAYEIYLERGGADGGDTDDWLLAERELTEKHATPRIAKAKSA
jgi:hypothetical protein